MYSLGFILCFVCACLAITDAAAQRGAAEAAKQKVKREIDAGKDVLVKARQVMGGPMGGPPVDMNGMPMQMPPQTVVVQQQPQQGGGGSPFGALGGLFSVFFG